MTKKEDCFSKNQRLLHKLVLQTPKTRDIGLLEGKMGAIILLYQYDRHLSQNVCSKLADDLLDKVWNEITERTPLNFSNGIYGIGWGIEYLIQNNFVEGEGADICEEINLRIIKEDPRRITDLSLESGLTGLLHYLLIHIKGCIDQKTKLIFDKTYLEDIYTRSNSIPKDKVDLDLKTLIDLYNKFFITGQYDYLINLTQFVKADKDFDAEESENLKEIDAFNTDTTLSKDKLSIGLHNNMAYSLIKTYIN